ncbi:MAG TPA: ribosome biogenesis GTPase Der [Thermodesulfovibrio thiophilus]|nr:ribosome biogenesis GTPase Der [Thermodesulfovibrio thiophilus]HQA03670.1 ribosome biogenesis GTPase Der [Thermodesulfovibrio thiophilus]HQD36509.1 ribosome biogenesis GTPase Der [Thermodesulfovibrio thiophilus]
MFTVVIVGRPNVGKSTLFNRMIKSDTKLKAITDKFPGVTRDINYGVARFDNAEFNVVDTGGFFLEDKIEDIIHRQMLEQIEMVISDADLIIHLLDGKEGLLPDDIETARKLRQTGKKIFWVVNKIDDPSKLNRMYEFFSIGTDELIPVSAVTGYGFEELINKIIEIIPETPQTKNSQEFIPKIAIVGRPNVGKSTIINALLGKKRMIVSPVPGTTRDAVDSLCTYYGKKYLIIDTGGIKRLSYYKKDIEASTFVEKLSYFKALKSIQEAHICIVVMDAADGIVNQDQKIVGMVTEQKKGLIILLNKWDLIQPEERDRKVRYFADEIKRKLWFVDYAPYLTVSAIDKRRLTKIFPLIDQILEEYKKRVSTAELNKLFNEKLKDVILPSSGKELKFYYITQVSIEPPTFVVFVNDDLAVKQHHIKFLEKLIRETFNFKFTPINIKLKKRK